MTPEKLALFEKCYRNWNGTSVMEGAFRELLLEVRRLEAECFKLAAGVCEYRGGDDHGNPLCLKTQKPI